MTIIESRKWAMVLSFSIKICHEWSSCLMYEHSFQCFQVRQRTSITGCVRLSVGRSVGWSVTQTFDDPNGAPYWPTWPCFFNRVYERQPHSRVDFSVVKYLPAAVNSNTCLFFFSFSLIANLDAGGSSDHFLRL